MATTRNSNAHSAKAIRRSAAKKIYSHDVVIGDEIVEAKTTCKLFGGMMMEKGKIAGDCLLCKELAGIQSLCAIATFPEILDEKKKNAPRPSGSTRAPRIFKIRKAEATDTVGRIVEFLASNGNAGRSMKEIKAHIGTKNTLYTTCGGHPDRIRKEGNMFFAV